MIANLFVYGTLMPRVGHPMGARLARESRFIGYGTVNGRLFDLGRYPALVEAAGSDDVVYGEVYALRSPGVSLKWLDAYEGIVPGREAECDYTRVVRSVRLDGGEEIQAWVYVHRVVPPMGRLIAAGRWRAGEEARRS